MHVVLLPRAPLSRDTFVPWKKRFLIFHPVLSDALGLDPASLVSDHVWIIGTSEEAISNAAR